MNGPSRRLSGSPRTCWRECRRAVDRSQAEQWRRLGAADGWLGVGSCARESNHTKPPRQRSHSDPMPISDPQHSNVCKAPIAAVQSECPPSPQRSFVGEAANGWVGWNPAVHSPLAERRGRPSSCGDG
jgi:hypothetical protein